MTMESGMKERSMKAWIQAINYYYDEYLIGKEPERGLRKLFSVLVFLNRFFPYREVLHIIGEDLIIEKRCLFSRSFHRVNPQKTLQPEHSSPKHEIERVKKRRIADRIISNTRRGIRLIIV